MITADSLEITDSALAALRKKIAGYMSGRRLEHTLAVEQAAIEIGRIYAPDKLPKLQAAALLHDITKEYSIEKQLQICVEFGIIVNNLDIFMPKIFHAATAAALIPRDFPEFNDREIISAVRWHTTGHENMKLCDRIIYLADYIDGTRIFEDCIKLRKYYKNGLKSLLSGNNTFKDADALNLHLINTLILSFDMSLKELSKEGRMIHQNMIAARNTMLYEKLTIQNQLNSRSKDLHELQKREQE
ncbi:MAG: HD domain-containing protein [Clostridiales bacterium]|nr:HD domain-containing protein [Clostridiales bacterium]